MLLKEKNLIFEFHHDMQLQREIFLMRNIKSLNLSSLSK